MIDNPADGLRAELADVKRRLRELETHSGLGNSSISSGSLQIRVPDGVNVPDDGETTGPEPSVKFGTDGRIGGRDGGTVKAGTTEFTKLGVGSGGTKIFEDGKIGRGDGGELQTKGRMAVDGDLVVIGSVDGRGGVYTPWEGTKGTVEAIMGGIKTTATNAESAASSAQSTADSAATAAATAQSRADSAWTLADGADKRSTLNAGNIDKIITIYNAHIDDYHSGGQKITL